MSEIPVFGTPLLGVTYKPRPSAYALVRNERGEVAVARTPFACFLPGGGMNPGETAEQTIQREGREECGFVLRPLRFLGKAIQICYAEDERQYFEKHSAFVVAEVVGQDAKTEDDHELVWLAPAKAIEALSHESHRWAVEQLQRLG